jgi:DNA polymerase III epsilon subunit-like protein
MTTIYFDFETGGVEPHHPNISLAAVAIKDGVEIESMHLRIQFDEALAQPEALAINHYDKSLWEAEAVSEKAATQRFSDFLSRHKSLALTSARTGRPYSVARLAGYNSASFDGPRANAMFDRHGMFPPFRRPTLDVLQLVLQYFDTNGISLVNNKLSTVASHFGIPTDNAHDALADCRMTAAVHQKLYSK